MWALTAATAPFGQQLTAMSPSKANPLLRRHPHSGPKGQFVYVVKAGAVEMREIAIERVDGTQTIVAKGLAAGEQVVTSGQSRLIPGMKVSLKSGEKSGEKK